jgi:uncharacterized protein with HEPN domain
MRDPRERFKDILDAIAKVESYAACGQEAFERDQLMQSWVSYHIQLIAASAVNCAELSIGFVSGCPGQGLYRHANHLR